MCWRAEAIREQVKAEIEHIPRGSSAQNELRMIYWPLRMNSLGKKAKAAETKEDIIKKAIVEVKKTYRDSSPSIMISSLSLNQLPSEPNGDLSR
jgi:hypothetical protein